jgi:hypothetical protein
MFWNEHTLLEEESCALALEVYLSPPEKTYQRRGFSALLRKLFASILPDDVSVTTKYGLE